MSAGLGYLGFQVCTPQNWLGKYVRSIWSIKRRIPFEQPVSEKLYPEGGLGITFHLGDHLSLDGRQQPQSGFLDGTNTKVRTLQLQGVVDAIGIRFKAAGAFAFLGGIALNQVQDQLMSLEEVKLSRVNQIMKQLAQTEDFEERIRCLERWLAPFYNDKREPHEDLLAGIAKLQTAHGAIQIGEIEHDLAISRRQLERLFQRQVGMSPKMMSSWLRVTNARETLKQVDSTKCVDLAYELGYADQSHFNREFKKLTGYAPNQYRKQRILQTKNRTAFG